MSLGRPAPDRGGTGCIAAAPRRARPSARRRQRRRGAARLNDLDQNRIWQALVALAADITAWTQLPAFTEAPSQWEPKRLRLRIFSLPAQTARYARQVVLHLPVHARGPGLALAGLTRLPALAVPG